jgi:hypothetical protein
MRLFYPEEVGSSFLCAILNGRVAQLPAVRSHWRLNFIQLCLMSVGAQYGSCLMSVGAQYGICLMSVGVQYGSCLISVGAQ